MVCCQLIVSPLVGCHWKPLPYHWVQLNQASLASKTIVDHWPFHRLVCGRTKPFPVNDRRWIKQSNWPFHQQLKKLLTFLSLQNFTIRVYRQNQQFWIWQGFQTRVLIRCSCDWHRSAGRLVPPPLSFLWCNFCPSRTLCLTSINAFTVVWW